MEDELMATGTLLQDAGSVKKLIHSICTTTAARDVMSTNVFRGVVGGGMKDEAFL
jgi:hypothetical protein